MTESSPAITLLEPMDERHNGSVGPLVPDMESKIIGRGGEELGVGEEGELVRFVCVEGGGVTDDGYFADFPRPKCNAWVYQERESYSRDN